VQGVLLKLDVSKGAGLDGIPPLILKNCAFENQRGFIKNRSPVTNLLEYGLNSIEEGWQVDSVYTAFRRFLIEYAINCYWRGYRTCLMLIAKDLFDREDSKDKNRRLCFHGYQADIGCLKGGSSRTIVFYLVCLQNIGDFRLRPCAVLSR
jgi:hypothetical protein